MLGVIHCVLGHNPNDPLLLPTLLSRRRRRYVLRPSSTSQLSNDRHHIPIQFDIRKIRCILFRLESIAMREGDEQVNTKGATLRRVTGVGACARSMHLLRQRRLV